MSATMIKEFRLPDLGEGLTESEILNWRVNVGDTVTLNQVIAEVETAKAVVELPSPFAGVVTALHETPGTVVEVGKPIVSFEVPDDGGTNGRPNGSSADAASHAAEGQGAPVQGADGQAPAKREPNLVGYGAMVENSGRPVRRRRSGMSQEAAAAPAPAAVPAPAASPETSERPRSTPPVRKLARDLGVDLGSVAGTGERGLITRDDVLNAAGQAVPEATGTGTGTAPAGQRETRIPIKGVRKATASAMVASAFTAPHVTEFLTVDATASMEFLDRLKLGKDFAGVKLTPLTLVARAVLIALKRNPSLNSAWDEANQEIVQFNYVNLGIAAATPRGLLVPNIKDAEKLPFPDLAAALADLAETARAGKTSPARLSGGTISITNIGVFGIDAGTPILNPGEAAILAVGAVRRMPWEYQGKIKLRQVLTLSLSFDHRLVDGEQGSRFLADVGRLLADPALAMTMA
ncbi:dihydrolipoamide acetyltransferase family protein [Pseudarthrobacter sp. J64]|uniref:dihydrolipoamide acetyltransferase family protein n=1 Tax=Pseudarthrobacter sp. J64 TaxID=3116485 RepID=UPI002E81E343|nr:dihydrolipoamide acetyltransferase family protein [Pseudarthrobacter sp. J64]MEE2569422.1 dihydrolipoamide acetyltransferase family protein [Pseudarthrobacter sp. J64]